MHNTERSFLKKNEQILWEGSPDRSILFSEGDAYLIPISVVMGVVYSVVMVSLFDMMKDIYQASGGLAAPQLLVPFLASVFVLYILYILLGRFFVKGLIKSHTTYCLTNFRMIIMSNTKVVFDQYLHTIESLDIIRRTIP